MFSCCYHNVNIDRRNIVEIVDVSLNTSALATKKRNSYTWMNRKCSAPKKSQVEGEHILKVSAATVSLHNLSELFQISIYHR